MKKKIIIGITASLFAIATVFNMGLLNFNKQSDVTLKAISVMIKAQNEGGKNSTTCSASASCITPSGKTLGSVSCSGKITCVSGYKYVTCDGNTSYCDI